LNVYDIAGRKVKRLMSEKSPNSKFSILNYIWDGKDRDGKRAKAGIYFIKIKNDVFSFEKAKKVILIR